MGKQAWSQLLALRQKYDAAGAFDRLLLVGLVGLQISLGAEIIWTGRSIAMTSTEDCRKTALAWLKVRKPSMPW